MFVTHHHWWKKNNQCYVDYEFWCLTFGGGPVVDELIQNFTKNDFVVLYSPYLFTIAKALQIVLPISFKSNLIIIEIRSLK